jgi:hypothetical protein
MIDERMPQRAFNGQTPEEERFGGGSRSSSRR